MCGIGGFFGQQTVPSSTIETMLATLQQRGPDAQHFKGWSQDWQEDKESPCHVLLHTRLSIRDLSHSADQPMGNPAEDIWICYNGEVYDWEGDAEKLKTMGYEFRTNSDTEFILYAYEAWGLEFIHKLRGMFAIVILDLRQKKLFALRDRMGIKPLLYYHQNDNFAFGSTVRSILPYLPKEKRTFSAEGIDAFLAHRYIPAPRTIFNNIQRLENGAYLSLDLETQKLEKQQYWSSEPKDSENAYKILQDAIRIRTASDRPVGLFLSGGIDSTSLASQLNEHQFTDFTAFTAQFDDQQFNESDIAADTAKAFDINHKIINIPTKISLTTFDQIVADLDEPFADPSCFPMWHLAKETVKSVTVVLGGDGGDELFAGYKRYDKHLRSAWRRNIRLPGSAFKGKSKLSSELKSSWLNAYNLRFSGFTPQQRKTLQQNKTPALETYWRQAAKQAQGTPLEQLLDSDSQNYLPEYILRKGDLCTMAHGLELRCPIIDHHFVQAVMGMKKEQRFTKPAKLWFSPALGKRKEIINMKKRGFNPPLNHWLLSCWQERFEGLGKRLQELTHGQISYHECDKLISLYQNGETKLAEKVLQLLVLDTSLNQLSKLS